MILVVISITLDFLAFHCVKSSFIRDKPEKQIFNPFNQIDGRKSLFTKPFSEIEFDDIEAFCEKWPEGVRVEYKRQIPNTIPKSVSSFANTLGGILIFGVETNENNKAILPIEGMPSDRGMQERIEESAFTGIYPPVTPEVKVCDVPDKNGNVVVLVRVNESPEAPHAIQNKTKVYLRVGSTTQPADIDRIEYMLKRREKPQEISDRILHEIELGATSRWSPLFPSPPPPPPNVTSLTLPPNAPPRKSPNLTLISRPLFPYRSLMSPPKIKDFIRTHGSLGMYESDTRQINNGVFTIVEDLYQEIRIHGIIYFRYMLYTNSDENKNQYLKLEDVLRHIFQLINVAKDFYQTCDYLGNVEIAARLVGANGVKLKIGRDRHYQLIKYQQSLDLLNLEFSVPIQCCAHDLIESVEVENVIFDLVGHLLWNLNVPPGAWEETVREMLKRWRQQS